MRAAVLLSTLLISACALARYEADRGERPTATVSSGNGGEGTAGVVTTPSGGTPSTGKGGSSSDAGKGLVGGGGATATGTAGAPDGAGAGTMGECVPATLKCVGQTSRRCSDEGGWEDVDCALARGACAATGCVGPWTFEASAEGWVGTGVTDASWDGERGSPNPGSIVFRTPDGAHGVEAELPAPVDLTGRIVTAKFWFSSQELGQEVSLYAYARSGPGHVLMRGATVANTLNGEWVDVILDPGAPLAADPGSTSNDVRALGFAIETVGGSDPTLEVRLDSVQFVASEQ